MMASYKFTPIQVASHIVMYVANSTWQYKLQLVMIIINIGYHLILVVDIFMKAMD